MGIGFLVFSNDDEVTSVEDDSKDNSNLWKLACLGLVAVLLYPIFVNGKRSSPVKTDEEIIKFVADEIYTDKGIYLNTSLNNVRVQKGGVDETYVQFLDTFLTCLYLEGIGIIERYPGESIKQIKKGKQGDIIEMKLADIGLARKKHMEKLDAYGLTEEEQ